MPIDLIAGMAIRAAVTIMSTANAIIAAKTKTTFDTGDFAEYW